MCDATAITTPPPQRMNASRRPSYLAAPDAKCWLTGIRRVAVAYHGEYLRKGSRFAPSVCSNAFVTHANHREMIFRPLERIGVRVEIFIHTFGVAGCADQSARLVNMLRPVAFEMETVGAQQHIDKTYTYIRALRLVLRRWEVGDSNQGTAGVQASVPADQISAASDMVVLCRFEAEYLVPLPAWNIDPRTLNLAFRDGGSQPAETTGKASDLVFVAPRSLSRTLLAALAESHDVAHLVWWPFVSMAGQSVHFIDDERQGSSMIGVTPFVSFVGLRRDCDNYNQTCARGKRPRVADEQVHLFRSAALSEPSAEVMVEALWSDELNGGLRDLLHARPSPPTNNPLTIQHLALAGAALYLISIGAIVLWRCACRSRVSSDEEK